MRTVGLIGGTSWHSTIEYYRIINQATNDHFGNNTNPPLVLYNLNQAEVHQHQVKGDWQTVAELIIQAAERLITAGAEAVLCCANTAHKVYDIVETRIEVPVLHIADATANAIEKQNIDSVAFIGTKFSMNEDFVTGRIKQHQIEVLVPESLEAREELHRIVHEELSLGRIIPASKQFVLDTINTMISKGAKGAVLGCTEFPNMISSSDLSVPVFDTAEVHARAAVEFVLGETCGSLQR